MDKRRLLLLLPFVAAIVISVFTVAYFTYTDAKQLLAHAVINDFKLIIYNARHTSTEYLNKLTEVGELVTQIPAMRDTLDSNFSAEERGHTLNTARDTLQRLCRSTRAVDNIFLFDANGQIIANGVGKENVSIAGMPYFQPIMQGQTVRSVKAHANTGEPIIYVGLPVMAQGKVLGGCFVRMDMQALIASLAIRQMPGVDLQLLLADARNKVIAFIAPESTPEANDSPPSSSFKPGDSCEELLNRTALLQPGSDTFPAEMSFARLGLRSFLSDVGLSLLASADWKQLTAPASALWRNTLIYSSLAGVGSIGLVFALLGIVLRREEKSRTHFTRTVDLARLAVWEWDSARAILRVNKSFNSLLGRPEATESYSSHWYTTHIHPDDLARVFAFTVTEGTVGPVPYTTPLRLRHQDGHWHWLEARGHIIHWDAQGKATHATGVLLDMHATRMEMEQGQAYQQQLEAKVQEQSRVSLELAGALHYERSLLHNVIDNIPDLIYFKNKKLRLLGGNRAFLQMFDINPADVRGDAAVHSMLIANASPPIKSYYREQDEEVLRTERVLRFEEKTRTPDGREIFLETCKNVMRDDKGVVIGVVGVGRDITQRKEAEAAIVHAKEEATAANKAKSNFLDNISHELRTPLNGIVGYNYLALQEDLPEQVREYLLGIGKSARALLNIVNDILDFSSIETGRVNVRHTPVRLHELAQSVVDALLPQACERGNSLTLDIAPAVPAEIIGDCARLEQVLIHLVGNAIKFTRDGLITVSLSMEQVDNVTNRLRISVEDTGIGIDSSQMETLFDPFTQGDASTTRQYGGTGLGLALVRALVKSMDGYIAVRSAPNKGSCFSFTLPMKGDSLQVLPEDCTPSTLSDSDDLLPPPVLAETESLEGKRVLLVEDNEINQLISLNFLDTLGCETALASNGQEAVDMAKSSDFDAVLMDLHMPVMDGITATRALRADGYSVPIIALTANVRGEDRIQAKAAGMQAHVGKPINFAELEGVLRSFILKNTGKDCAS